MADTVGQTIAQLPAGVFKTLCKVKPTGALQARKQASGAVALYWRYSIGTASERVLIGLHDPDAKPKSLTPTHAGYSVAAAVRAAETLALEHHAHREEGGRPAMLAAKAAAERAAMEVQHLAARHTLKALCDDYVAHLEATGKASSREARTIFQNHIIEALPNVARKPAAEVEKREIVTALRRLTEQGKTATARKLRAYLHAAYACALRADSDATLPSAFISYRITSDPVGGIAAIKGQPDKRPLTAAELRTYWKALQAAEGVIGAALRLQVLTGAQRVAQLTRLTATDVRDDTMRLLDPKGKRDEAREHLLPITRPIRLELDQLTTERFVLSTDGGKTPMHPTSISAWAHDIGTAAGIKDFQLKRVRSGIETMLAAAGISREIRGQLQSHGISGVQARHYDAHEYLAEKRKALEALHRLLEREPAKNVTPLRKKRA